MNSQYLKRLIIIIIVYNKIIFYYKNNKLCSVQIIMEKILKYYASSDIMIYLCNDAILNV